MRRTTKTLRIGGAVIAAVLLAACGGGADDGGDTPTDTEASVEKTEKAPTDTGSTDSVKSKNAQALVDKCAEDGTTTREVCLCQIGAVEEALGEDDFNKLVEFAKNDDDEGAEAMMTEIMSDKPEIAMQMGMKMMSCDS